MSETPQPVDSPSSGSKVFKRILIWGLVLLVVVVTFAELGVVRSESTDTQWTANSKYETTRNTVNRQAVRLQGFAFSPSVSVTVSSGTGKTIADRAAETIRQVPAGQGAGGAKMEIKITEVTTDGAHWVPFFKSGSCTFAASYVIEAAARGSTISVRGQITGKVEQSMKGICSTSLFRENLGKAVAAAIVSDLQKVIAKGG